LAIRPHGYYWHQFLGDMEKGTMENHEKVEMTTMSSCTNSLIAEGYTENFIMKDVGLEAPSTQQLFTPEEITIDSFYRFEGESDPADNAIVYAIKSKDGVKGLLIDAYGGPYVSAKVSKFIAEVQDIGKRKHIHNTGEGSGKGTNASKHQPSF